MSTVVEYDGTVHNADFLAFRTQLAATFDQVAQNYSVFRSTGEKELFNLYLAKLPEESRQYHTCSCCREFLNKYGTLVYLDEEGRIQSAMFQGEPPIGFYREAFKSMKMFVEAGAIRTVFASDRNVLGEPVSEYYGYSTLPARPVAPNGDSWVHFYADWPTSKKYTRMDRTHRQHMAFRLADHKNVTAALRELNIDHVHKALTIVKTMSAASAQKFTGPLQWFYDLQKAFLDTKAPVLRSHMVWAAIAEAPDGFLHIQSTAVGTLVEDVAKGKSLDHIKRAFKLKTDSLTYQRAQKPASEGNIKRAEGLIGKMGIVESLQRRHALLSELPERAFAWKPPVKAEEAKSASVFGHLRNASRQAKDTLIEGSTPETISFTRFVRTVLPHATRIQHRVTSVALSYTSITTATVADAKPILMWDKPDARNPFTWYTYKGGSRAQSWNLEAGELIDVLGIVSKPSQWTPGFKFRSDGVLFILAGCCDQKNDGGLALFPYNLDRQLHEVRQTIEEFSNEGELTYLDGQQASGLMMSNNSNTYRYYDFIVETAGVRSVYHIDRFE